MTNRYAYNVLPYPTDEAVKNDYLSEGKYLKIHKAPSSANITVKLGSTSNSAIAVEQGSKIRVKETTEFYISHDAVTNGMIEFIVSDSEHFDIVDSNSISRVDEISTFGIDAMRLLQFLTSEILSITIKANSNYLLDVSEAQGIKFTAKGPLKLQSNGSGGTYPIIENKEQELFLQHLGSNIRFINDTDEEVGIDFQIMGNSQFKNMDYVESGYVVNGYIF